MAIGPTSGRSSGSTDQTPIESSGSAPDKNLPIDKQQSGKEHGDALTALGRGKQADLYASIGVGTATLTRPKRKSAAYQSDQPSSTKKPNLKAEEPTRTRAEQKTTLGASERATRGRMLAAQEEANSQATILMHVPGARIERAAGSRCDKDSVGIAKFWDSIDDEAYGFLMGTKRRITWMKKNGKDAKYTFGADGIFLCKDDDENVVGMAWYSHLDKDITLPDGEKIRKDKFIEESIAIKKEWRGHRLGTKFARLMRDHLRENTEVTHVLAKIFWINPKVIEWRKRCPEFRYIGEDEVSETTMFLEALTPPEQAPQMTEPVAAVHRTQLPEDADRMQIDDDSDALSEHSSTEFAEYLADIAASTKKSAAQESASSGMFAENEGAGLRRRIRQPDSYAEVESGDEDRMDIDNNSDYSTSAHREEKSDAAGSRSNLHVFNVDRQHNILRIRDPNNLPTQQLALIVLYNKHPDQSMTEACQSLATSAGLSLNYINSVLNNGNIGDDAAKRINDYRTSKQGKPGQYQGQGAMRKDRPDLGDDVLFWPPELDELITTKAWKIGEGLIDNVRALRPTDEASLLKLKETDYPRYQLNLLMQYNQGKDRPFSEGMGLSKSAVGDVLNGTKNMGPSMVGTIHAFKTKKEKVKEVRWEEKEKFMQSAHNLSGPEKRKFLESANKLFFWPPEFKWLISHAEWNPPSGDGKNTSQSQLFSVIGFNAPLPKKAISVLMGMHQDRLSAYTRKTKPEAMADSQILAVVKHIKEMAINSKISDKKRTPETPSDVLCLPPGFKLSPSDSQSESGQE